MAGATSVSPDSVRQNLGGPMEGLQMSLQTVYTTQYTVTVKCCEVHSTQLSIHNTTMTTSAATEVDDIVCFFF